MFPARMAGEPNNLRSYDPTTLTVDHSGTYFANDKNIPRHLEETCTLQGGE